MSQSVAEILGIHYTCSSTSTPKGCHYSQTNRINISRQIKSKDSLKLLTKSSELYRENIRTKIIAITGSCGKTTLKELLGNSLKQLSTVGVSPKSYNNKYGVPLSLFNLDQKNNYGVLEIGMDKKGEIDPRRDVGMRCQIRIQYGQSEYGAYVQKEK